MAEQTNVLVVGSGGREHAIAHQLVQSPRIGRLVVVPGNGGTGQIAENVLMDVSANGKLVELAKDNKIDLTVVGSEELLARGIVDDFHRAGLRIFGPTQAAARLETSKAFAKKFMFERGIPTAPFRVFDEHEEALAHIREHGVPIVIKASGLALGKGAYPCKTLEEAEGALKLIMLDRIYGAAGDEVVIEDFLRGQELSVHVFCDDTTYSFLPISRDYKRALNGNKGPNTGGMGSIAPVLVDEKLKQKIEERIVRPILQALAARGSSFVGMLYPGIMVVKDEPYVLEFNVRPGDPETQSVMCLLKTDLFDVLEACVDGKLADIKIEWHPGFAVCVVLASGGYPGEYKKYLPIRGIAEAEKVPGVVVFHAGTRFSELGVLETFGGRVLNVTAVGDTLEDALARAYEAAGRIWFEGKQFRTDIGQAVSARFFVNS
jgi:phosphoribosylamine--glycine ligase